MKKKSYSFLKERSRTARYSRERVNYASLREMWHVSYDLHRQTVTSNKSCTQNVNRQFNNKRDIEHQVSILNNNLMNKTKPKGAASASQTGVNQHLLIEK